MSELPLRSPDRDLLPLLSKASSKQLQPLVDALTRGGKGRLTGKLMRTAAWKKHAPDHKMYWEEVAAELQLFGANTVTNVVTRRGAAYRTIAFRVARRIRAKPRKGDSVKVLEDKILMKLVEKHYQTLDDASKRRFLRALGADAPAAPPKALGRLRVTAFDVYTQLERTLHKIADEAYRKMSPKQKNAFLRKAGIRIEGEIPKRLGQVAILGVAGAVQISGFAAYQVMAHTAGAVARAALPTAARFGAVQFANRGLALAAGPVGWTVGGAWIVVDAAGPAYRVITPSVIEVGLLRRRNPGKAKPSPSGSG